MTFKSVLTAVQMRHAEQDAIAAGVTEYALMERAGAAAAEIIWRAGAKRDLLVLCGPGNNGGDGFVIARLLRDRGLPVRVAVLGESRTDSSRKARAAWNGPVEALADAAPATQIVDALFGTGLSRGLDIDVADQLAALTVEASFSYAIDLPSGVETDSGALLSQVPSFGVCIALGAFKPAHLLYPAAGRSERLICADIGVEASDSICRLGPPALAMPAAAAHKYSRGLVAVVGGAMAVASSLASHAAARSGAGMVRHIGLEAPTGGPDAIVALQGDNPGELATLLSDRRLAAVVAGPGMGQDDRAKARLASVLNCGRPLVLDADALTLLGDEASPAIPTGSILTPHEGEFARLFGNLPGSKIDKALEAARRCGAVIIYKGADSVIASPDGRAAISAGRSSWLSTAGTGDVLAGLVAGRLAVTGDPFRAACEAVWLHGEAARRAGAAFIADDLIMQLPAVIASRL